METLSYNPQDWQERTEDILVELEAFNQVYRGRPFDNENGIQGSSAFSLYYYVKKVQPKFIIEAGVWRGFSTWIMENAVPNAQFLCLDPVFALDKYLVPGTMDGRYRPAQSSASHQDFSCVTPDLSAFKPDELLVFFDDHQNKLPRLAQAKGYGIKHVIFDDNFPWKYTHFSLEQGLENDQYKSIVEAMVSRYEVMPPLWDVHFPNHGDRRLEGLNIPGSEKFSTVYAHKDYFGFTSYLELQL